MFLPRRHWQTSGNIPTITYPVPRLQIASFSDYLAVSMRIIVASNIAQRVRSKWKSMNMCGISKTKILIWRRRTETQPEAAGRPGTDFETEAVNKYVRDATILAGVFASRKAAAVVIPIRWLPVESWSKAIRAAKPVRL